MQAVNQSPRHSLAVLGGAMLLVQLVAGVCFPIAKYGLGIIEPFTFAFYRFILSSCVLLAIARLASRGPRVERGDWKKIILLGFLIIPFNQTLFLVGQSMTGAGHGAFIFSTTPVWIFVLALIHLKEALLWRRVVGVVLATGGVMAIMISGKAEFGTDYLLGDIIILFSVLAWAYYAVLGKRLVQKYGALRVTAYAAAAGSAMYLPFGLFCAIRFDYSQSTLAGWGTVVYMAIGMSVVVYVLWYWLLKQLDASRIAVYHNIQPVIAVAVAHVFLGEPVGTVFVIGGLVVLAGMFITEV